MATGLQATQELVVQFGDKDMAGGQVGFDGNGRDLGFGAAGLNGRVQVARCPGDDAAGDVFGVFGAREQVIGAVQRDEALGVAGGFVDFLGLLDGDCGVVRRVKDQQGLAQTGDAAGLVVAGHVFQELALDGELATGQRDGGFAVCADGIQILAELTQDVAGLGRCGDGGDGTGFGNALGRGQHGGTAQAVADQQGRRLVFAPQEVGGGQQVGDVGGEVAVGEVALAGAQTGEVEAHHGHAACLQGTADAGGSLDVLAAGEAVGEEGEGAGVVGQIQDARQFLAAGILEGDVFLGHDVKGRADSRHDGADQSGPKGLVGG